MYPTVLRRRPLLSCQHRRAGIAKSLSIHAFPIAERRSRPTPYQSGDVAHEQGISKAGNRRMRTMLVEIAWCWLRFQPQSELALWYQRRFGQGNSRQKKIGIVALARKLLVALWKYLDRGEVPAGAELTTWEQKVNARLRTAGPPAESIAASCRKSLPPIAKSKGKQKRQTTCLHASAAPFDLDPG